MKNRKVCVCVFVCLCTRMCYTTKNNNERKRAEFQVSTDHEPSAMATNKKQAVISGHPHDSSVIAKLRGAMAHESWAMAQCHLSVMTLMNYGAAHNFLSFG